MVMVFLLGSAATALPATARPRVAAARVFRTVLRILISLWDILVASGMARRLLTLVQPCGQAVSCELDDLHHAHQQQHHGHHHLGLKAVVAVADGQVADAAATYYPRHR